MIIKITTKNDINGNSRKAWMRIGGDTIQIFADPNDVGANNCVWQDYLGSDRISDETINLSLAEYRRLLKLYKVN